jgi:hypothetical protein
MIEIMTRKNSICLGLEQFLIFPQGDLPFPHPFITENKRTSFPREKLVLTPSSSSASLPKKRKTC